MTDNSLSPPRAKTNPHTFQHLGRTFSDPYTWLQDKNDPEVIAYLNAENNYSKSVLMHTKDLQERLFQEMKGRIQEDDSSVPALYGSYLYYSRTKAGHQYKLFCRSKDGENASEEILIDENVLAQGLEYCRVSYIEPSPDNNFLAYGVDTTGSWVFNLYIKDMRSGEIIDGPIPETGWGSAWASDSQTLFYTQFDTSHRPYKLYRHQVGNDKSQDVEIYHEVDDAFNLSVRRTRSGGYILFSASSATTSEVRYLPADRPKEEFKIFHPRQHWMEYDVEHHGNRFLIRSNENAENFKLLATSIKDPIKENWHEIIPHRQDTLLEKVSAFANHLVLFERKNGLQQIRISAPDAVSDPHYITFPDPTYAIDQGENRCFETTDLRFQYSSLVRPESTIDYGLDSHTWDLKKQQEIPSGYDPDLYQSERLFASADDGTQVPISLVYRKGFERSGTHPLLLYGYGSYGSSTDPRFNQQRLSLIDRGFVFAIAHVRGGSELGRSWYEQGRLQNKKNTFTDFIACADHLVNHNYTRPENMVIMGGSAGGLLVSAVANMRPDLCKAVVAMVPFTNMITAMLDRTLPLTVIEWEQWGNPEDLEAFNYMLSYSPYDNIESKAYPNIYTKTGLNDLQVPYWDPAKWVAKLRAKKTDDNKLLLVTNMGAGHGGASGRYDYLRESAEYMAFVIDTLGVPDLPS